MMIACKSTLKMVGALNSHILKLFNYHDFVFLMLNNIVIVRISIGLTIETTIQNPWLFYELQENEEIIYVVYCLILILSMLLYIPSL
jgi:hypothetical protein